MSEQSALEKDVAELIVECLCLEEIAPQDIEPTEPLFNDGLGLDSIDALEIALAISQKYGCELRSDDERNAEFLASLRSLSAFIAENRVRDGQ